MGVVTTINSKSHSNKSLSGATGKHTKCWCCPSVSGVAAVAVAVAAAVVAAVAFAVVVVVAAVAALE